MISREPEVVARRMKKHFKGEGFPLLIAFIIYQPEIAIYEITAVEIFPLILIEFQAKISLSRRTCSFLKGIFHRISFANYEIFTGQASN